MLGSLLKPGWQNASPEKRRLAILKMNIESEANQSIFETLAISDRDLMVRQACIRQLNSAARLFKVYQQQLDTATKKTAKVAFCNLLSAPGVLTRLELEALLKECPDATILVGKHCFDPNLRATIFDSLSQLDRAQAIAEVAYVDTRFHIAQHLNEIEPLELARRLLKGKDKNSEKIIRAKIDLIRSKQKIENNVNDAAVALCEQMEFIANHPEWRSEFKGKYEHYEQRWNDLSEPIWAVNKARFESATAKARLKVERQRRQESAHENQDAIAEKLEQYCETLAPLSLELLAHEQLSINTILGEALSIWLENNAVVNPPKSLSDRFLGTQQGLSSLYDLVECTSDENIDLRALASKLNAIKWPKNITNLSAKLEASHLLNSLRQQDSDIQQKHKESLDSLHKRINRLLGTSNKGDIRKAKQELSATTKATEQYSGKDRKTLDERLEMASEIVSKMNDWQNFATEPKLIELCSLMEKLSSSKAHPDKLAQEILKLQNAWKRLANSDISSSHWPRFKTAADIAYEPCALFFEQRKATQKRNLENREPLIEKLRSLLSETLWDEAADFKKVEIDLRNTNNEWRKIKDVERNAGQKQWARFSAIREQIHEKLEPIYEANIAQKKHLTSQVTTLVDGPVSDQSLEKLKLFQSRWKQVGITRRKEDQAAWELFRSAGDELFEKVRQGRNEKRAVEDQQFNAYRDIINHVQSLAKSANELSDADIKFEEFSQAYEALPPLPKGTNDRLIERFDADFKRASDAYSVARDRIIQTSKDEVVAKLRRKAGLCSDLEKAVEQGDSNLEANLRQEIESVIIEDKTLNSRFNDRLAAVSQVDKTSANNVRTHLCIDLEILLDIPSPAENKALRMQIQLDRMKNIGMGHSPTELKKSLAQFTLDWLCLPGAESSLQSSLEQRFMTNVNKAK